MDVAVDPQRHFGRIFCVAAVRRTVRLGAAYAHHAGELLVVGAADTASVIVGHLAAPPDWISENKRWSARGKAASAVLVPALALMVAVPVYRVHQVPVESPGFDVPEYEAQIKAKLEAGLATAKMYEDAYKAYRGLELDLSSFGPAQSS